MVDLDLLSFTSLCVKGEENIHDAMGNTLSREGEWMFEHARR